MRVMVAVIGVSAVCVAGSAGCAGDVRSDDQQQYTQDLWKFVQSRDYQNWDSPPTSVEFDFGPPAGPGVKQFWNKIAARGNGTFPISSLVVAEHHGEGGELLGVTLWHKSRKGFDSRHDDWYWAHYIPGGEAVKTSVDKVPHEKRGYVTMLEDGRLWVFPINSKELIEFKQSGELAKHIIRPGDGPGGITVKSPDADTIAGYLAAKPGFETFVEDGRLWVFASGSPELKQYKTDGELAKHVTRPGDGPRGITIKGPDSEVIDRYLFAKPGFVTKVEDGRLWVFRKGSDELAAFEKDGELAKHVTVPGGGPRGMTIKAPDNETIAAYMAATDGFETFVVDGRIWVFKPASPELKEFKTQGELAKHVIRPSEGPGGMTVKAPDSETIDAYLQSALVE